MGTYQLQEVAMWPKSAPVLQTEKHHYDVPFSAKCSDAVKPGPRADYRSVKKPLCRRSCQQQCDKL